MWRREDEGPKRGIPTPVLETSAVAPVCQLETGETEGGDRKTKFLAMVRNQVERINRGCATLHIYLENKPKA